jgi:membrane-associated protease RseP (regulator of RpoE activity)
MREPFTTDSRMRASFRRRLAVIAATMLTAAPLAAQTAPPPPPPPPPAPDAPPPPPPPLRFGFALPGIAARAMLGVGLEAGTDADTLGPRIASVTSGGPAERAGLREGQRILAIDGTRLAISADDAADPLTADAGVRRLQRIMRGIDPGDTVTLRVRDGGTTRTVRVATMSREDFERRRRGELEEVVGMRRRLEERADRPMLGVTLASTATARDTLGVFVASVVAGGPAERAGLIEGARIASVNGTDVRVPPEDAGDASAANARRARLSRTLREAAVGEPVSLRVWLDGRWRELSVTPVAASELPRAGGATWFERDGATGFRVDVDRMRPLRFEGGDGVIRVRPGPRGWRDTDGRVRVEVVEGVPLVNGEPVVGGVRVIDGKDGRVEIIRRGTRRPDGGR